MTNVSTGREPILNTDPTGSAAVTFEFRLSKYDTTRRDERGAYTLDEWTAASDIGQSFAGVVLTADDYQQVEDAYITVASEFLAEASVKSLAVIGLENSAWRSPFAEGQILEPDEIAVALRGLLREHFWCRLESPRAFIHAGYDYYIYLGLPRLCPDATALVQSLGLFVEPFRSPHRSP